MKMTVILVEILIVGVEFLLLLACFAAAIFEVSLGQLARSIPDATPISPWSPSKQSREGAKDYGRRE